MHSPLLPAEFPCALVALKSIHQRIVKNGMTKESQVQDELQVINERLSLAVEAARLGTWDWQITSRDSLSSKENELIWSDRCLEIFGLPPRTAMTYERFLEAVYPEDRARIDEAVQAALRGELEEYDVEMRIVWRDGSLHWANSHGRVYFDGLGKPVRMSGIATDITERKRTEDALRKSEEERRIATERFELALRGTPITVFTAGLDLRYKWVYNPVVGPAPAEMIGKRDAEILERREDAEHSESIKAEVLRTGKSFQGEMSVQVNGELRSFHVNMDPERDAEGRVIGLSCVCFDLTPQKRIQKALEESEAKFRLLFTNSLDAIYLSSPGMVIAANPAACELFGMTEEEFKRARRTDFMDMSEEALNNWIADRARTGRVSGEMTFVRKDASRFIGEFSSVLLTDGQQLAYTVVRDITARKLTQEAVQLSEARYRDLAESLERQIQARTSELQQRNGEILRMYESLRELSGRLLQVQDQERRRIARDLHDSAGQLLAALSIDLANLSDQARAVSPPLVKEVEAAQELVQQLHKEIRTTSYLLHPPLLDETGLFSALNWYVQGVAERSGITIELDIPEDFGRLPRELELVIFRLVQESLTNIHRHSGSKTGSIGIARNAGWVTIQIEDQGKGISPERLAAIETTGSGMGIRGMRERLRQFQGELHIHSGDSGTRVLVTIPIPQGMARDEESGIEPWPQAV